MSFLTGRFPSSNVGFGLSNRLSLYGRGLTESKSTSFLTRNETTGLLADSKKIGKTSFAVLGDLESADVLIADSDINPKETKNRIVWPEYNNRKRTTQGVKHAIS